MQGSGYCECGCGERTETARKTSNERGWVKGQPKRFVHGHNRRKQGAPYVVEDRGYETPCWIWIRTGGRYGHVCVDGEQHGAHRVFYERLVGPIPDGLVIDHLCRVERCVNPNHLEPVTNAENLRRAPTCKLSFEKAAEIRASAESHDVLAARYGVHPVTIRNVRRGKAWVA